MTPTRAFNPRTFFREMVWKALLTRRTGQHQRPTFPKLAYGQVAITWIGHASFLLQFTNLNVLIDPNFANWLFLLKRIKRSGLRLEHLPPIDLVLLTHAHFDHILALNEIRAATHAPFMLHADEVPVLEAAKMSAASFGMGISQPAPADRVLKDGDEVTAGSIRLKEGNIFLIGEQKFLRLRADRLESLAQTP